MARKKQTGKGSSSKDLASRETFPIVGLGASAGGLEALKTFFSHACAHSGMAYIVVVHLSSDKPSLMPELLQRATAMPVAAAEDGQVVEPDHVYILPPDKDITLDKGAIHLTGIADTGLHLPINRFFRSLAGDQGAHAVAVVLSGTGTDGSLGIKEIKAQDGLVLVQSPDSAKHDGMPRSAMATGTVDMVLSVEEMPATVAGFFEGPPGAGEKNRQMQDEGDDTWLGNVFALLRTHVGHDFSAYKRNTLLRRIRRRMGLNRIADPYAYCELLRDKPDEVKSLFQELLIGVTSFFREPESFETLRKRVLPDVFARLDNDDVFRVWIPACSTGEEAYSLTMLFRECLDTLSKRITLQVFGTDIDKGAIAKAREGLYPSGIAADVNPERLMRFFVKDGDWYRIRKEIRDSIVFSVHDVLKDPPFSRLNMLCCRNLLIYLGNDAQKRLLPLFHYSLKTGGLLMLGSSETIGGFSSLFKVLDSKWKVFARQEVPAALMPQVDFPRGLSATEGGPGKKTDSLFNEHKGDLGQLARNVVLDRFSPAALLMDANAGILHVSGRMGKYLEATSGPPSQNALDLAREGLGIELSSAMRAALASGQQQTRTNVRVQTNGSAQRINLHVCPLNAPKDLAGLLLVVFEDMADDEHVDPDLGRPPCGSVESCDAKIVELERELQNTRESHQTTIEELESSNEELKSTNEELQSSNEELQSTNEEMESSKEELQSLNEELQTVNAELQGKLEELSAAHDDMHNLLNSTEIATIFVDNDMRIKRFTQQATAIVNLIPTDTGRPLQHVMTNLAGDELLPVLEHVLKHLAMQEKEVRTLEGKWYAMRVMPYRTMDNRIDGCVLTFAGIDDQKRAQDVLQEANVQMQQAWQVVRNVFDTNPHPLLVLEAEGEAAVIANTCFMDFAGLDHDAKVEGLKLTDLLAGQLSQIDPKGALRAELKKGRDFTCGPFEVEVRSKKRRYMVQGMILPVSNDIPARILLYFRQEP